MLGFFKKIFARFTRKPQTSDESRFVRNGNSLFNMTTDKTLTANETLFAVVSKLSNSLACLPLKLYENLEVQNNSLSELLSVAPNNNMTAFDFICTMETIRSFFGNAYAIKRYDDRMVVQSLEILDPTKIEPVIEENTGELWYELKNNNNKKWYVHNSDIIHVKHIHTIGYKGVSPIDVLRGTINNNAKIRKFTVGQVENALQSSFIVKYDTHLNKEKKAEIIENFKNFFRDNGGILIEESGVTIREVTRDRIDSKSIDIEKLTDEKIANAFGLPLSFLKEGNAEDKQIELSVALTPICRQYEQEFNKKLLIGRGHRGQEFKFTLNGLLRASAKTRADVYSVYIRSGIYTLNELRKLEDLPPVDNAYANELLISRDISLLKDVEMRDKLKDGIESDNDTE